MKKNKYLFYKIKKQNFKTMIWILVTKKNKYLFYKIKKPNFETMIWIFTIKKIKKSYVDIFLLLIMINEIIYNFKIIW
jgi:hypothetical protein